MAIQKEIWQDHIIGNLYKNNDFLLMAFDADSFVLQGKVVHIPNAGGAPSVSKNRTSLPASAAKRTDVDISYSLDEYTSDPVILQDTEKVELAYDKRESLIGESVQAIRETIADNLLYAWAPAGAGYILRTSGASIATHMPSSTGTRSKFVPADLKAVQLAMDKQNVASEDRFCIMSADMYNQLTDSLTETQYRDFSRLYDEAKGILGEIYGFKVFKRSWVLAYTNATPPVVKLVGAAGAATDNDCVLCWQKGCVERALGEVTIFEQQGNPQYYGDLYSTLVRMGGRIRRNDLKGVIALVQNLLT